MINYLTHTEIDRQKWDACIDHALNALPYAYTWYLDQAAPGWDALVMDDYEAVFPLTHARKYGIDYLYQPLFTQQLGLFYRTERSAARLVEFLHAVPERFRFIDVSLNEGNAAAANLPLDRKKNYVLELDKPYAKLHKQYSENARRNLGKARKAQLKTVPVAHTEVTQFYIRHKGKETTGVHASDYGRFNRIVSAAAMHTDIVSLAVLDKDQQTVACGLFMHGNNRIIYMMGSASEEGRKKQAMQFMLDEVIRLHSGQPLLLDFEGSEIPGVARFFKSFGARKQLYYKWHENRLPWYMKWLKK